MNRQSSQIFYSNVHQQSTRRTKTQSQRISKRKQNSFVQDKKSEARVWERFDKLGKRLQSQYITRIPPSQAPSRNSVFPQLQESHFQQEIGRFFQNSQKV